MAQRMIANRQTPTVVHPAKAKLDLPALVIVRANTDEPAGLGLLAFAPLKRRDGGLDAATTRLTAKRSIA
jgi:hypothetical protein